MVSSLLRGECGQPDVQLGHRLGLKNGPKSAGYVLMPNGQPIGQVQGSATRDIRTILLNNWILSLMISKS